MKILHRNIHKEKGHRAKRGFLFAFLFLVLGIPGMLEAQEVSMRVTIASDIKNAQSLNLQELGLQIINEETTQTLFNLQAQNNSTERLTGLQLKILVKSSSRGELLSLQSSGGFELFPDEQINTDSDNITDGIFTNQGREIKLDFDVDIDDVLTDEGSDIVNNYVTSLPIDVYTIELEIYSTEKGRTVGRTTALIGTEMKQKQNDIFLSSPGDVVGSASEITTTFPSFRWEGEAGIEYRLVVVVDNGEGAEALLNSALSTEPTLLDNGASGPGSLLEFEMVDAQLTSTEFQYPTSGVQALTPGKKYFWQVSATFSSGSGSTTVFSEIWEFNIIDPGAGGSSEVNDQLAEELKQLFSPDLIESILGEGYSLVYVEIDGQSYTGVQILSALQQFKARVENGEITL